MSVGPVLVANALPRGKEKRYYARTRGSKSENPAKFGRCPKGICLATRRTPLRTQLRHNSSNAG